MTTSSDELALGSEFGAATRAQWLELAAGVLRKAGRDLGNDPEEVERLLSGRLADGVPTAPLYTPSDAPPESSAPGVAPFQRGTRTLGAGPDGWDIRQRHADPDASATAEAVLADLRGGATSLWLVLGTGALPVDALPTVLREVRLELAPVALDAAAETEEAAEALLRVATEQRTPTESLRGTLGADPLGWLTALDSDTDLAAGMALAGRLAARCAADHPRLRAVTVDATAYHNVGADDAQELGISLAAGVAYLRALTDGGLSIPDALHQLEFRYAATADQFGTIAKLRAARALWARVGKECGAPPTASAQRQHAVSSESMITARDPAGNMLRGTLACFGAGVGGADAVTVLPFDTALGLPDALARRLSRNTQSLLIAESNLSRVIDPAGGSWYVERLTEALARRAWEVFTGIERAGGLAETLRDGSLGETLTETWRARARRLATREEPITGVSEFAEVAEQLPRRAPSSWPPSNGLLPRVRRAEAFESLRDRTDAHAAATGTRPSVFLAPLGRPVSYTARASFAANLFQAGGLATPSTPTTASASTPEQLAEAFADSGAPIACLCGSDESYQEQAEAAADALRGAGARRVLLAGAPATVSSDAISGYVYAGCDAVEVLAGTLEELGVRP